VKYSCVFVRRCLQLGYNRTTRYLPIRKNVHFIKGRIFANVFGGRSIDTQKTLPFGTPEEVYKEARERIDIFDAGQTGFVFNSLHNIQSDVLVENVLAMFKAVDDARRR
jgi:uroporphyrinogen-III decarboxylase